MTDQIEQTTKATNVEIKMFVTPLIIGTSCAAALIASVALFYSSLSVAVVGVLIPLCIFAFGSIIVGSALLAVVSLVLMPFKRRRKLAIQWFISAMCLAIPPLLAYKFAPTEYFKTQQVQRIEQNAEPVITALKKYSTENNGPPENLKTLVPRYIAQLPVTGEGRHQNFDYKTVETADGLSWELSVELGLWVFGASDHLIYNPSENYPPAKRTIITRYGKWAYISG